MIRKKPLHDVQGLFVLRRHDAEGGRVSVRRFA